MVFSGLLFLYVFLPVVLMLYFIGKNTAYRKGVLIAASLVFYAWGEPVWVVLLIAASVLGWGSALILERAQGRRKRLPVLWLAVAVQLSGLVYFKYAAFFLANLYRFTGFSLPFKEVALPIGISFYTFQIISYLVDVYRKQVTAQPLNKVMLYVSLFPQLVAGPIVRYTDIERDIDNRRITLAGFSEGITRFAIGLGKKVIFANQLGEVAAMLLDGPQYRLSVLGAWFGISLFALQIYFDFSGYSDMAIGLGKMFGFTYPENFNYPYVSKRAGEFWRRWNMSLGAFFRDYVYIPLGGNRRWYARNLFIVWGLTGLWHGASWNFVLWGLYFGVLIFLENKFLSRLLEKLPAFASHLYGVLFILVGWTLFYFTDLRRGLVFLSILFGATDHPFYTLETGIQFRAHAVLFVAGVVASLPIWRRLVERWMASSSVRAGIHRNLAVPLANAVLLLVSTLLLVGESYNPFLYFRF